MYTLLYKKRLKLNGIINSVTKPTACCSGMVLGASLNRGSFGTSAWSKWSWQTCVELEVDVRFKYCCHSCQILKNLGCRFRLFKLLGILLWHRIEILLVLTL